MGLTFHFNGNALPMATVVQAIIPHYPEVEQLARSYLLIVIIPTPVTNLEAHHG